jgi:hypothetical protein
MTNSVFEAVIKCNYVELMLFRRALAQAVDQNLLPVGYVAKRLTEIDEIRRAKEEAMTRTERMQRAIARQKLLNMQPTPSTMKPGRPVAQFDRKLARELRAERYTLHEIATICNVSKATMCRFLKSECTE